MVVISATEVAWGDETSPASAALQSPADQPAKLALVADLKKKYDSIQSLNARWGSEYKSWEALLSEQTSPAVDKAGDDLREFYTHLGDEYFRVCRDAVKAIAPDTLYLGCRFAWVNERAVRSAAKYCDVIVTRWQNFTGQSATLEGDGRTFEELDAERHASIAA